MFIKRCVAFIFFFSVFLTPTVSNVLGSYPTNQIKASLWISPPKNPLGISQPMAIQPDFQMVKGIVKTGDTTFSLLNKYIPMQTIYRLNRQSERYLSSHQVKKGHPYKFILLDGNLTGFEYKINKQDKLVIQREEIGFSIMQMPLEFDRKLAVVSATITSNLVEAIRKSGERHELAWKLSDIFAWDIDFSKNIQPGDRFDLLIEKRYLDGQFTGYGKIQAASFTHNGTCFKAFLHKDSNGVSRYYDENGTSLQKSPTTAPIVPDELKRFQARTKILSQKILTARTPASNKKSV
jgi:Csd3 second domain